MSPVSTRRKHDVEVSLPDTAALRLGQLIAQAHGEPETSPLAFWSALLFMHLQEGRVYLTVSSPFAGLEWEGSALPSLDCQAPWLCRTQDGTPVDGGQPLALCGDRLWLARYYDFDLRLREALDARRRAAPRTLNEKQAQSDLKALFPDQADTDKVQGQALAAAALVDLNFGLLTGGPGTGKTTSLAKMLLLHLRQQPDPENLKPIHLLAPTGKAAHRLKEGLNNAINAPGKLRDLLAGDASWTPLLDVLDPHSDVCLVQTQTLHKALGVRFSRREGQGPFWKDREHPLESSLVIVDEVSMVDLALMTRLVEALSPTTPLLLVGDAEQLESVEAGSVLPEWAGKREPVAPRRRRLIAARSGVRAEHMDTHVLSADHLHLTYNHRFAQGSIIGQLAAAANGGRADEFLRLIESASPAEIQWIQLASGDARLPPATREAMLAEETYGPLRRLLNEGTTVDPAKAIEAFDRFRVLCALRKGPDGVEAWNERLQRWMVGETRESRPRAIMVAVNDPASGLCNGDSGLILPSDTGGLFHSSGGVSWPASLLPTHEPGWAITIHKSQGSEYDTVAIVLPRTGGDRLLTRRLLYTALTRARRKIILLATEQALRTAARD